MATDQELQVLANCICAELNGEAAVEVGVGEVGAFPVLEILKWVRDNKEVLLKIFNAAKDLWDAFQKPADGTVAAFNPAWVLLAIQTLLPLLKEALPKIRELLDKFRVQENSAFPTL